MPGPFGQPTAPAVDLGFDIAAGYQQDATNKISQARVKARKAYTGAYAKKYGVADAAKATKGLSDTDVYELATNLVNKRRGVSAPKPTTKPATPPKVTAKTPTKPKATAKAPAKVTAKAPTRTTTRRPRRRTTTKATTKSTTTKATSTSLTTARRQAAVARLTAAGMY